MESNEKDALWDLLAKAKPTEASPYFVRKVLRSIEQEQEVAPLTDWRVLLRRWLFPAAAAMALALGGWLSYESHVASVAEFNDEFDSIAELTSLIENQDETTFLASGS